MLDRDLSKMYYKVENTCLYFYIKATHEKLDAHSNSYRSVHLLVQSMSLSLHIHERLAFIGIISRDGLFGMPLH